MTEFHKSIKDSYASIGASDLQELPKNWKAKKLGSLLKPVSIKNRPDLQLLSITRERGVIVRDIDDPSSNHNFIPDDLSGYKVLRAGQFGMNKMKAWQGSYGVSKHTGIVSPAYFIFDFLDDIDPAFFNWAIRSKLYVSFFGQASDGVRIGQWDLSKPRMNVIPFLYPSLDEQNAIVNFLDDKTEKIQRAIAIKEKQIELLKERKQILIQNAVTRGLNPDAPMKESGIDWIGKIPSHWECCAIREKLKFRNEKNDPIVTEQVLSLSIANGVTLYSHEGRGGNKAKSDLSAYKIAHIDDIVLNSMNVVVGAVGLSKFFGAISPVYYALYATDDSVVIDYFEKIFLVSGFQKSLIRFGKGILMKKGVGGKLNTIRMKISKSDLKLVPIPVPPKSEQLKILTHLKKNLLEIDALGFKLNDQVELLKEYKASLVNSVVMGKIKVPT